jgi:hypothetical protein
MCVSLLLAHPPLLTWHQDPTIGDDTKEPVPKPTAGMEEGEEKGRVRWCMSHSLVSEWEDASQPPRSGKT